MTDTADTDTPKWEPMTDDDPDDGQVNLATQLLAKAANMHAGTATICGRDEDGNYNWAMILVIDDETEKAYITTIGMTPDVILRMDLSGQYDGVIEGTPV